MEDRTIAGRYRLTERIGTGGMGVVWRAEDQRLRRVVAVKELLSRTGFDQESIDRAIREGRIAARLSHPNVIALYDVVEHDGHPWLIMEYLPSRSLAAVMGERGPLPPDEVARLGVQLASGLSAAHKAGVMHRDVKPGNVLVTEFGTVKVTDFGTSRAVDEATVTASGMLVGTPAYLSPEVARGDKGGFPADVFALGATLYAATEGTPPFGVDGNTIALLHRVAEGKFAPPGNAGPLTPVLMRLLDSNPDTRPTMAEAEEMLRNARFDDVPPPAAPPSHKPTAFLAAPLAPLPEPAADTPAANADSPAVDSPATDPAAGDSAAAASASPTPGAASPASEPPAPAQPGSAQPGSAQPGPAQPAPTRSESAHPEQGSPKPAQSGSAQSGSAQSGSAQSAPPPSQSGPQSGPPQPTPKSAPPQSAWQSAPPAFGTAAAPSAHPERAQPGPAPTAPPTEKRGDRKALIALGVVVLIVIAVVVYLVNRGDNGSPAAGSSTTTEAGQATSGNPATTDAQPPLTGAEPDTGTTGASTTTADTTSANPEPTTTQPPAEIGADQALAEYYGLLPTNLEAAYARLTDGFKATRAPTFAEYAGWWNQMSAVSVANVQLVGPDTVSATVSYTFKSGGTQSEQHVYTLVKVNGQWAIDTQSGA